MRILIIDDSEDAAHVLAKLVRGKGHEAWIASNGTDSLEVAADVRPDLVFLDICMPGIDGYETALRLRQRVWMEQVPIYTISAMHPDPERAQAAGITGQLMKPVRFSELDPLLAG